MHSPSISTSLPVLDYLSQVPDVVCHVDAYMKLGPNRPYVLTQALGDVDWRVPLEKVGNKLPADGSPEMMVLVNQDSAPDWLNRWPGKLVFSVANRKEVQSWLAVREAMTLDEPARAQALCDQMRGDAGSTCETGEPRASCSSQAPRG